MPSSFASFDPLDPSTFGTKKGGLPGLYTYQLEVTLSKKDGTTSTKYISYRTNTLTSEEDLLTIGEGIVLSGTGSEYEGEIDSIDVIGGLAAE